jgi:hypothetical protein
MSWWESDLSRVEWVNALTSMAYAVFGVLSGDPVFAIAMCWLAVGSGLFHAHPTKLTTAIDHSGMYASMMYLVVRHWGFAAAGAAIGLVLPSSVLVPAMGALLVLSVWRALTAVLVFALAYVVWNVGKRRWDDDGDPNTVPWYARYCHGAWHILTAYGMYLVRVG